MAITPNVDLIDTKTPASVAPAHFFIAGGTLPYPADSYIIREADEKLFNLTRIGEFAHVLTPSQLGKSSLMLHTAKRLEKEGIKTAMIDLNVVGLTPPETWYLDIVSELANQLPLNQEAETWWETHNTEGPVRRFITFLRTVVLAQVQENVVIFIDEINSMLKLGFKDEFFAAIRSLYNLRAEEEGFKRLSFVFLGIASPFDLMGDSVHTPFNISHSITLQEFSRDEAEPLEIALTKHLPPQANTAFDRIYYWTSGHPYLTQKLCQTLINIPLEQWTETTADKIVDTTVERLFLTEEARNEANLQYIRNNLMSLPQDERDELLQLYAKIHQGQPIGQNEKDHLQIRLKLFGLVRIRDGRFQVRNEIYKQVFNLEWVEDNSSVPIVTTIDGREQESDGVEWMIELYKKAREAYTLKQWDDAITYLQAVKKIENKYTHNYDLRDVSKLLRTSRHRLRVKLYTRATLGLIIVILAITIFSKCVS